MQDARITLILNASGSYNDTPYNNFNGSDSFTYTLTDAVAGESDTRTVDITVTAVDDASAIIAIRPAAGGQSDLTPFNRIMFARHIRYCHSDNHSDRR